jgi:hypothetical protein
MVGNSALRWLFFLALVLAGPACGQAALADEGMADMKMEAKTAGNFQIELMTEPTPPKAGENVLTVHLKDKASGESVTQASIRLEAAMDESDKSMKMESHEGPQRIDLTAEETPGDYSAKVTFSDPGPWKVKLTVTAGGVEDAQTFDLQVVKSGPNWVVIGGFLGAILLIVVAAAMVKSRSKRTP